MVFTWVDLANDPELALLKRNTAMHEEADESEEKHDKSHSKRRDVRPDALLLGVATLHESTDISDTEQEDDRGETNGSVKLCIGQGLEGVDDDLVRGLASVDL